MLIKRIATSQIWLLAMYSMFALLAPPMANSVVGQDREDSIDTPPETVAELVELVRAAQFRLLKYPGGFSFDYRVNVQQDPEEPYFVWEEGIDGHFAVKWPVVRTLNRGKFSGFTDQGKDGKPAEQSRMHERESSYDFSQGISVARDGNLVGQIANFRHAFSAKTMFPFHMQSFEQAEQLFVLGQTLKTDYWLPSAMENREYSIRDVESVDGMPCIRVECKGIDSIWFAYQHGYVVRKRLFGTPGQFREELYNDDLIELGDGVWLPQLQTQVQFDKQDKRLVHLALKVSNLETGDVEDQELAVQLDGRVAQVDDFVTGRFYVGNGIGDDRFEQAVASAQPAPKKNNWYLTLVLLQVIVVLGWFLLTIRRRAAS